MGNNCILRNSLRILNHLKILENCQMFLYALLYVIIIPFCHLRQMGCLWTGGTGDLLLLEIYIYSI